MNAATTIPGKTRPAAARRAPAAQSPLPEPPAPFVKPRPGTWTLDAGHCERPVPHFARDIFPGGFSRGMREGFAAYGALLETIEMAEVNGFLYSCPRPLGAPPEPKGLPPKPVFRLLTVLHPGMRKRLKRSAAIWAEKPWREETRRYLEEWMPAIERETERLRKVSLAELDDAALARHLGEVRQLLLDDTYAHHRMNCTRIVPVGDFIAHVVRWTGATMPEVLEAMRGFSPESRDGLAELRALARALEADPAARAQALRDGEAFLAGLEARRDAVGEAARAWVAKVGHQITGYSPGYPTLRETPATLVEALRGALAGVGEGAGAEAAAAAGKRALEALRARVPESERAGFDALLEEARHVYFLRDHACLRATAAFGVARLAVLEAGRRLVARGLASEPEAALDATQDELLGLLRHGKGPSRQDLDRRLAWRRAATADRVPERLGPPPGSPPPVEWLPGGAARLSRAVDTYLRGMFEEGEGKAETGTGSAREEVVVRGLPATGGKRVGTARLVLEPGDFDRVAPGDVLVARITTPTYNVLLPLLAGIVTDRGGILSHPAIVSREFGIPGVVGARVAISAIPDGARVEIDGDAGTVRVLP